jgi:hypothetical protein
VYRVSIGFAFSIALVGFAANASAAPSLTETEATNPTSPIIQVDHRCGYGRHFVPRHRVRGHDGHLHWVGGV